MIKPTSKPFWIFGPFSQKEINYNICLIHELESSKLIVLFIDYTIHSCCS